MKPFAKRLVSTVGCIGSWLAPVSAHAVSPRAYVSVNGDDLNTCSVPVTPCRTLTGAISQVTPGGTVIVMDSGTFGGGTISQAVTVNAPAGVVALVATPIVVNPGSGQTVVLRGLTLQSPAPGSGNGTGITQQSGRLFVENTLFDGWNVGLNSLSAAQGLFVKGSTFRNHFNGALQVDYGNTASVAIDDSFFERNFIGVSVVGGNGRVSNTVMTANNYGAYVGNLGTEFMFQNCEASGNGSGLYVVGAGTLRVSQSTITGNGFGLQTVGSGWMVSFGNNIVRGNTTEISGAVTAATLQ